MRERVLAYFVVALIAITIFCMWFFNLQGYTPKAVEVRSSKSYFDVYDKPIMYEISIVGTVEYTRWVNRWKRKPLKDSLRVAHQRIMDDYFQTNYIDRVSDDTIIDTFDIAKYFSSDFPVDSISFEITVEKKIFLKQKPPS